MAGRRLRVCKAVSAVEPSFRLLLARLTRDFSDSQQLSGTIDIRDDGDSGLEFLGVHEGEWMRRRRGNRDFLGRYQSLSIVRRPTVHTNYSSDVMAPEQTDRVQQEARVGQRHFGTSLKRPFRPTHRKGRS